MLPKGIWNCLALIRAANATHEFQMGIKDDNFELAMIYTQGNRRY